MAADINEQRGRAAYAKLYKSGGWKYSFWKEYFWHRRHIVKRFALTRGMRVLEVACGTGFHTNLLNRMGFDCTGVDRSEAGIAWARQHYPRWTYICCDLRRMPLKPESFDVVLARGCSHFHYDLLSDVALGTTATLMRYLKPGGRFVMVIVTNLSGAREPDKIWHNTLEEYRRHFSSFGHPYSVDWANGMAICAIQRLPEEESIDTTYTPGDTERIGDVVRVS